MNPRVPWSVPVKTLVGTGFETCTGFVLAREAPDPCSMVETCGASVGGLCSAADESAPDADINCKINRCKKSYVAVSYFASPEYGCLFGLPVAPSTGRDYPATG